MDPLFVAAERRVQVAGPFKARKTTPRVSPRRYATRGFIRVVPQAIHGLATVRRPYGAQESMFGPQNLFLRAYVSQWKGLHETGSDDGPAIVAFASSKNWEIQCEQKHHHQRRSLLQ